MRRHIRRLLLMGVTLVITGLVFYIAAQGMVQNPLSFRAVELVPPEDPGKDWRHCLHYEIKNESRFPVVVHGLMWIDLYPDGGMAPGDRCLPRIPTSKKIPSPWHPVKRGVRFFGNRTSVNFRPRHSAGGRYG